MMSNLVIIPSSPLPTNSKSSLYITSLYLSGDWCRSVLIVNILYVLISFSTGSVFEYSLIRFGTVCLSCNLFSFQWSEISRRTFIWGNTVSHYMNELIIWPCIIVISETWQKGQNMGRKRSLLCFLSEVEIVLQCFAVCNASVDTENISGTCLERQKWWSTINYCNSFFILFSGLPYMIIVGVV